MNLPTEPKVLDLSLLEIHQLIELRQFFAGKEDGSDSVRQIDQVLHRRGVSLSFEPETEAGTVRSITVPRRSTRR